MQSKKTKETTMSMHPARLACDEEMVFLLLLKCSQGQPGRARENHGQLIVLHSYKKLVHTTTNSHVSTHGVSYPKRDFEAIPVLGLSASLLRHECHGVHEQGALGCDCLVRAGGS